MKNNYYVEIGEYDEDSGGFSKHNITEKQFELIQLIIQNKYPV